MFSFWSKKKTNDNVPDSQLTWLNTDIHCHVLPGIDDGAKTVEDAVSMIKEYMRQGVKKIVATSHIKSEQFPNSRETITDAWTLLMSAIKEAKLDIDISYSAEYYLDAHFLELLDRDEILPLPGKYLLVETSMARAPMDSMLEVSAEIIRKGYTPVLAHPERYLYWKNRQTMFGKLKDKGWLLQVNLLSLAGHYGEPEKRTARYLLDNDLVDFVGTDAHSLDNLLTISGKVAEDQWLQKLQNKYLLNKFLS